MGAIKAFQTAVSITRGAVEYASSLEQLRIRMDALAGSSEAGGKALAIAQEKAKKFSFDLKEITRATPNLMPVSETFRDLANNIELTADLAAVSGLSFEETAQQLQRAFSSGACNGRF